MPKLKIKKSEAQKILTLEEKAKRLRMSKSGYISYRASDNIQRWLESTSVNIIIALLILVSVFLIILEFMLPAGPKLKKIEELNDILTWFFCVELTLRGLVARNKKIFFSNYWIDILAVVPLFRFFRTLRVLRLLRILRLARAATMLLKESGWLSSRLEKHFGSFGFLALTAALLVVCSSVAYLNFERVSPDQAIPISELADQVWTSSLLFVSGEVVGDLPKTQGGILKLKWKQTTFT